MKNFVRITIIAILTTTIRYILVVKLGLDIKQGYEFFFFFTTTGITASIVNIIFDDIYPIFSLKPGAGGDIPNQTPGSAPRPIIPRWAPEGPGNKIPSS